MMIPSSLLKPIYIAYALGEENGKVQYDKPLIAYAQLEEIGSTVTRENVGILPDYDRVILMPFGSSIQFINEQSLIWVNVEPNEGYSNANYKVERVGDIIQRIITLYCKSLTPNTKSLYYERNGKIYHVKVDYSNLVAWIPFNMYLPIDKETNVWETKPTSTDSTNNKIKLSSKRKLNNGYKLVFTKV